MTYSGSPNSYFKKLPNLDYPSLDNNRTSVYDYQTVKNLILNHNPIFIVGLGMKGILIKMGVHKNKIIELD